MQASHQVIHDQRCTRANDLALHSFTGRFKPQRRQLCAIQHHAVVIAVGANEQFAFGVEQGNEHRRNIRQELPCGLHHAFVNLGEIEHLRQSAPQQIDRRELFCAPFGLLVQGNAMDRIRGNIGNRQQQLEVAVFKWRMLTEPQCAHRLALGDERHTDHGAQFAHAIRKVHSRIVHNVRRDVRLPRHQNLMANSRAGRNP